MAARSARRKERLARAFGRVAAAYERGRPDYPWAAIRYAARTLGLGSGSVVIDLAAGTGKLTRALRTTGATLIAVEPSAGMRAVFHRVLPDIPVVAGRAEAMPLPPNFADAVFVGQAFHWFRPGPAAREIARVLRPGGGLVAVWNTRDDRYRLSREFTRIVRERAQAASYERTRGQGTHWERPFRRAAGRFQGVRRRAFPHTQTIDPRAFLARALSVSHVASRPPAVRRRVVRDVRQLLAEEQRRQGRDALVIHYQTEVFVSRKRGRR
jgi:ubiquinone/menaquinone biosynthesis C-methylase UbiE